MSSMKLRFAARCDIGQVRKNNEDSGYASHDLLVVADGMGGHEAGELASAATVAAIVEAAANFAEVDQVLELLSDAVITSGEYIADVVSRNRDFAGMGTTMTALAFREDRIAVAHVGDSRAYLLRDEQLQQMTKDHTFVQSLVDSGEITREQAAVHPRRNLMMRAIDGIHAVEVDLSVREARVGDRFLLCSDGLCGVISEATIQECLLNIDLVSAVSALIDAALDAGGPDNITVIVADLVENVTESEAVIVGAAADVDTHNRLPGVTFPEEAVLVPSQSSRNLVPRRHRLVTALVTLAVAAAGVALGLTWLASQWFIGVYSPTKAVAIYQGIPVAGLSRLIEVSSLNSSELPDFERNQIIGTISSASLPDAQATIEQLSARVMVCRTTPNTPGCPAVAQ